MLKKMAWVVAVLIVIATSPLQADDTSVWDKLVQGIGKSTYFAAFPTATYKGAKFRTTTRTEDGTEVVFEVYGLSAFDHSDLWTEVIVTVKDFEISNVRWGRNNALLAQPGETLKNLGDLLVEINKQIQANQRPNPATVRLTWVVQNQCPYAPGFQVKIFDETNNLTWPTATGDIFPLAAGVTSEINVDTYKGAKVCIGAKPNVASSESHWGVGIDNQYGCDQCCFIADNSRVTWPLTCNE
jgi:hypothetical protein